MRVDVVAGFDRVARFARQVDHFALRSLLQSLGISLRSATEPIADTSTGKLMEGVLAAFAQFDNDCRSDRTRAGMEGCAGARPLGVPGADRLLERRPVGAEVADSDPSRGLPSRSSRFGVSSRERRMVAQIFNRWEPIEQLDARNR